MMAACENTGNNDGSLNSVEDGPDNVDLSGFLKMNDSVDGCTEDGADNHVNVPISCGDGAVAEHSNGEGCEVSDADDTAEKESGARVFTSQDAKQMIHKAVGILREAEKKEKTYAAKETFSLYKQGLELLMAAYKKPSGLNQKVKNLLHSRIQTYLSKAEHLKEHIVKSESMETCPLCTKVDEEKLQTKEYFKEFIMTDKKTFDDVIGNAEATVAVKECLILPIKFPQLFTGGRCPPRCMVMFGHPGTGKTLMLSALAGELPECTVIKLSVYDFMSKYRDGERNIRELFQFAREKMPCVLSIEDIDVLDSTDQDERSNLLRRLKTELCAQVAGIDGFYGNTKAQQVFVVFVTQRPWQMCAWLRRRACNRIFFDLPTKQDRVSIIKSNMNQIRHNLTEEDLDQLGDRTLSLGGSRCTQADLVIVCRDAVMQSVRKIQAAKYFKQVVHPETGEEGFWTPCHHDDAGSVEKSWTDLESDKLLEPDIEMSDFLCTLDKCQGTVNADDEARMQQWVEDFTTPRDR